MRIILASLILSALYTGAALAQIYIANQGSNSVSVINCPPFNIPTVTVDVGMSPNDLAVTPDGDFVYVAGSTQANGMVAVIQTSDNTVVATVDVGTDPTGIAVTTEGSHVYVVNEGSNDLSVI